MRALSPLLLALFVAAPAMAADPLPGDRPSTDRDASTNFNRLGVKSLNADRMTLRGSGSTGDVSGMAVTAGGATRNLAAWFPLLAPVASPSFSGTVTAPALTLTAPGSTGDVSAMSVRPTNATAASLSDLLKNTPRVGSDGAVSILNGPTLGMWQGGKYVAAPDALRVLGGSLTVQDTATPTYPAGLVTQVDSQLLQSGINDGSLGAQSTAAQGGFFRTDARPGQVLFQWFGRAANSSSAAPIMLLGATGGLAVSDRVTADNFFTTGRVFGNKAEFSGNFVPSTPAGSHHILYSVNTGSEVGIGTSIFYKSAADRATFDVANQIVGIFSGATGSATQRVFLGSHRVTVSPLSTTQPFNGAIEEINPVNRGRDTGYQPDALGWISYDGGVPQVIGGISFVPESASYDEAGQGGEGKNVAYGFSCSPSALPNSTGDKAKSYTCFQGNANALVAYQDAIAKGGGGRFLSAIGGGTDAKAPWAFGEARGYWVKGLDFSKATFNGTTANGTTGAALHMATGQTIALDTAGTKTLSYTGSVARLTTGLALQDSASPTVPFGIVTQADSRLAQIGINDGAFGAQVDATVGGFLRFETRGGPVFQFYGRPGGTSAAAQVATIDASGNFAAASRVTAPAYTVGTTPGATCTGAPTANFRTINGIVTAC